MLPRVQSRIGDHLAARAQYIWTRQFGQHDASQSITNAADAPTVAEFLPGFETSAWAGVGAPKNTPVEIVERLNQEINAAIADPSMKARM